MKMKNGLLNRRWWIIIGIWFMLFVPCSLLPVHAQMNTDRITAIGRNALYFEDYVLSIQYFNQVIKLKPYLPEPYQLRAIAKIQLGDYQGALRDCNLAIDLNPFHPGYYYTRGFVYRATDRWEEAEQDFSRALSFSPDNKTYLTLRADIRAHRKNYEGALEDIDFLLAREPRNASIHFEKGVICLEKQDTLCAISSFEKSTQYDTQNPHNWSALGTVQLTAGQEKDAQASLTRAIDLGSKWAGDYINRGIIAYRTHDYRNALADYDKAVELAPEDAQSYYNRGMLRSEVGDYNRAIEDYDQAIHLAPEKTEMHYQRGATLLQLKQWNAALNDFNALMARYPTFIPAYYLAAQAEEAMGHRKQAERLRFDAREIEQKGAAPNTGSSIAQAQSTTTQNKRKAFSPRTAQNGQDAAEGNDKYRSPLRGTIQDRPVDVVNEPNIVLSYYGQNPPLRRTNYYYPEIDQLNRSHQLAAPLRFVTQETTLTAEMVNQHFEAINRMTLQIERKATAELHFARAVEFALVQDYRSALEDCARAITMMKKAPAYMYYMRANWRFKLLEYQRSMGELTNASTLDFEIMNRDYDYCIRTAPDFAFAYYNKANMLCIQQAFEDAIRLYTDAIRVDSEFAEAYFNRGLTKIYIGLNDEGIEDLSKAGELGIYQAYNLISQLK